MTLRQAPPAPAAPVRVQSVKPSSHRRARSWFATTGWRHLIGFVASIIAVFPILYVLSTSLSPSGTLTGSNRLFAAFTTENYRQLFTDSSNPYPRWLLNTLVVSGTTAILSVFLCALGAYAFSRLRFSGRRFGLGFLLVIQMLPQFLGVVAIFLILDQIGEAVPALGLGSIPGLIAVYLGGALGVNTYLMYGYLNTIPQEIDEAARMDGADPSRIFFTIILPLITPILVVVGMLIFVATAGDFVIASVVLSDSSDYTTAVGLYNMISLFQNDYWGAFCAGAIVTSIAPLAIFLYAQKYFVSGLFTGGGK